jgi:hypothetical protein
MKKIKLFSLLSLFVIVAGVLFIFAKKPGAEGPETIMVKCYQAGKQIAWVDYGNGRIEETKLDGITSVDLVKSTNSKILTLLQRLNLEGYKVISHSESYYGTLLETYILTKK